MRNNNTDIKNSYKPEFKKTKTHDFRNYFLVVLLIIFEDSPFFLLGTKVTFWILLFILLLIFTRGYYKIFDQKIFMILSAVWVLMLLQLALFGGNFTPAMIYKPFWIFYTPFLVFVIMGLKYFKYLFNVIYYIAIYTSIIYLLHTFSPSFNDWLMQAFKDVFPYSWAEWPCTILIYSIQRESGYFFMRNSGVFHEPGAYSIYLMLAIVINTFYTKQPFNRKNIFLAIVLLSTFSTAGYIMLFVFLSYAVIKLNIPNILKPVIIIPFVVLLLNVYQSSIFLEQKIIMQYEEESKLISGGEKSQRGRFYSFGMSMKSFASTPIFGRGFLENTEYNVGKSASYGYGFAGLFARYGLFFGLFYMWFFYKGFLTLSKLYKMPKNYTFIAFIVINMGLLTQIFFFHTPFIYFFLIGLFSPSRLFINTSKANAYDNSRFVKYVNLKQ